MRRQNRQWRLLSRLAGVLLLLLGSFCGYWWFYRLGPARHTLDARWVSRHSQQEYWREVQKGIHRGEWLHDDGRTVGLFGDKSWAERIMNHVRPGTTMGCFSGDLCHSATAMRFITNQDVGEDADVWLDWWAKNKAKSQEEWIADGFANRGFNINVPPRPDQTSMVLTLLGNSETSESTSIPEHMKYNAFRCLRDSGFQPVQFALSNHPTSDEVQRGLFEYAKWERRYPEASGLGMLPFANKHEDREYSPLLLTSRFQIMAYTIVFAPVAIGSLLVLWSFRKNKSKVKPQADSCFQRDRGQI